MITARQVAIVGFVLLAGTRPMPGEGRDLYLLIGQSNMAGRGELKEVSRLSSDRVWKFTKHGCWADGSEPIHFDRPTAGAGPGLAFARALADADPSCEIGLVPCAEGGSPLARWVPGGDLYSNAVTRMRAALATGGRLRGILWHQGEADSWSRESAASYAVRLTNMVTTLRAELGHPYVPFIAGEVGAHYGASIEKRGGKSFVMRVNNQIRAAIASLPAAGWVSADGLEPGSDGIHFRTESAYELGRRYAREIRLWQTIPDQALEGVSYGGKEADWRPTFAAHGFNLQGMRMAAPSVGFRKEHFQWMRAWGFNLVRLPLDYRCWVKDRRSANREIIDESGLKPLDEAIGFARANRLVAMLCLHRIPGEYCIENKDPEPGNIYTDPDCLRAAVKHWSLLAARYRDVPRDELIFNLFNEPSRTKGTIAQYEYVCRVLIAAIRRIDPKRYVVVDGWAVGVYPVEGLYGVPGVGQSTRGYYPCEFSHFGMDGMPPDYPPPWPPCQNIPDGRFGGPGKLGWHAPFTLADAPAGEYELRLSLVSGPVKLAAQADGRPVAAFTLRPQPNHPDWTDLSKYRGQGPWRGAYRNGLSFCLEKPAKQLAVQLEEGDWAIPRVLVFKERGRNLRLDFSGRRSTMKNANWNRRYVGGDGTEPMPPVRIESVRQGRYGDAGMDEISSGFIELWREPVEKGVWCLVGEFGCANHVRHSDALRFMESNLKVFHKIGLGWCDWGFVGSSFGILNSHRQDVRYEDWQGHKLDRAMLELLRKYAVQASDPETKGR